MIPIDEKIFLRKSWVLRPRRRHSTGIEPGTASASRLIGFESLVSMPRQMP